EGPHSFGNNVRLKQNMLITIEPGVYLPDKYGIRIENVMLIEEYNETSLYFKPLTLVPIDIRLLSFSLLTDYELNWVMKYNKMVLDKLTKYFDYDILDWYTKFFGISD
ncbi:MAG: M24 family metallopeptidase C-terminal domain-containing protein, partial [Anaplasmataceae bacterium]|nr:M24 family metallopeptidase C-terminal domain-containing protein [Anaplasmataceae bacterium]